MAIGPKEAKALTARDETEVKRLEEKIDAILLEGGRTFAVELLLNEKVKRQIIDIYTGNGWRVTYHSDQRDGDYLQFSEREPLYDGGCGGWRE
ncbi:MAG: hypothetical protein QME12_07615 [Nanoarchaeota archaeon]|nr:hypothetical protein [Nanoarchaeota archaeon]